MSVLKNRASLKLVRRAKTVLNLVRTHQVKQATRKLERKEQELAALRAVLTNRVAGAQNVGVKPENVVWVFGSGRTGSSWFTAMMRALPDHTRWNEPMIGHLFGHLYYERSWPKQDKDNFILGNEYKEIWLSSIRSLVLEGGLARFPERAERGYLVIKEPHGSLGAPLLMQALPESRMIFLIRDPRDVMASALSVTWVRKGGRDRTARITRAERRPEDFVRQRARTYLRDIKLTEQAYEAHKGHKVLVRYEDLRVDTLREMNRIYSTLEIPVDERDLAQVVEKFAWENLSEDEKGSGKVRRKAKPGGWREDLTPEQVEVIEKETAQILDRFYAGDRYRAPQ